MERSHRLIPTQMRRFDVGGVGTTTYAGTFHVQTFFLGGFGAAGGEGDTALLQHVHTEHAIGATAQALEDVALLQEYRYVAKM